MPDDFHLRIGFETFDCSLLENASTDVGTEDFSSAVTEFFCDQFEAIGGTAQVIIDDSSREILVKWSLRPTSPDPQEAVLELLRVGQLQRAVPLLWTLIQHEPRNVDNHYNIGVAYNQLGQFDKAIAHLQQAVKLAPTHVNALAALGFAQIKTGDLETASQTLESAIRLNPNNIHVLKNLGVALLQLGRLNDAEPVLRQALEVSPEDVQTMYGLGQVLEELGRDHEADVLYRQVVKIGGNDPVVELAAAADTRMAERTLQSRSGNFRPHVMEYCRAALDLFTTLAPEKVQAIGFEIAVLGQSGLDINNPDKRYQLKELSGEFTGLQLCTFMYVAFRQVAPEANVGIDFSAEYEAAVGMQ